MPDGISGSGDRISVIGVGGGALSKEAERLLDEAVTVVGGRRQLDALTRLASLRLEIGDDMEAVLDAMEAAPRPICVLASGDPGFFGVVRALAARFGPGMLDVHPAPSSVSLAFARLGMPWDDAVVVSAHGRPLAAALAAAADAEKVAVLTSPEATPRRLGAELLARSARYEWVAVCSDLGLPAEQVQRTDVVGLAEREWPHRSVVVLVRGPGVPPSAGLAWGLPEEDFAHRTGMITKSEVRAVALGKLSVPPAGVVWDVGAGSGSVAVECARLAPALRVIALDRSADSIASVSSNARRHGVTVESVCGLAPEALGALPDPDRAFVGGGGIAVLDAVLARLRPGGRVVATYASLDRAARAYARLGNLVQVGVSRARPLGDGVRLEAENPVFVAWGAVG